MNGGRPEVAVIGGGFSGALVALHLLSIPAGPRVHLIEGGQRFGAGRAYGVHHADHLLNVRAGNMSAFPDQPDHFVDWLRTQTMEADPACFFPRATYGRYLSGLLRKVATGAGAAGRLVLVNDVVIRLRRDTTGVELGLAMGRTLRAGAGVLALGSGPPRWPHVDGLDDLSRAQRVDDPWSDGALREVAPDRPVLVLGSGLTMIDVVSRLVLGGHAAPIFALSRRGLAPHRHVGAPAPQQGVALQGSLSAMLRQFRDQLEGDDWRPSFDALRASTPWLWGRLSAIERRRFLNHLRPYWDVHRHRLAPTMHDQFSRWRSEGRVRVVAGRPLAVRVGSEVLQLRYRPRGERIEQELAVGLIVNATGPETDPTRMADPLLVDLRAAGLVRPDGLRLGLDVTQHGEVIDQAGRSDFRLTAIGPLTRGMFWEAGAVPDLRVHALNLARRLGTRLAESEVVVPSA